MRPKTTPEGAAGDPVRPASPERAGFPISLQAARARSRLEILPALNERSRAFEQVAFQLMTRLRYFLILIEREKGTTA